MPPHCDTRDGPVVIAAKKALETGNPGYALIRVPEESEKELKALFKKNLKARKAGKEAHEVADDWFFENTVRLHRAGEGVPYTIMKPAGLSGGPVVPRAEKAIGTGNSQETIDLILGTADDDLTRRFHVVMDRKNYDVNDVAAGREFIEGFIGRAGYSRHPYEFVRGEAGTWKGMRVRRAPLIPSMQREDIHESQH